MGSEHLEFDKIHVDIDGEIATITLNAPDKLNALTFRMMEAFSEALLELGSDKYHIRAALIKGAGRGFCSGLDLSDRSGVVGNVQRSTAVLDTHVLPMIRHVRQAPFPTICAVNGPCVGIGVTLALLFDVTIVARSAYFFLPFVKNLGSLGDAGISWILPRVVGWSRAKHMMLFGTKVGGEQAVDWGMAYEVTDDGQLQARAEEVTRELATGATVAQAALRRFLWDSMENVFDRQIWIEIEQNLATHKSEDYQAALAARAERKKVVFRGR